MSQCAEQTLRARDRLPFRFLDLPQEIQDIVHSIYLDMEGAQFRIEIVCDGCGRESLPEHKCEERLKQHMMEPIPSLKLEQACRKMMTDSRVTRNRIWPRTLFVEEIVRVGEIVNRLATLEKYVWIRNHINSVVFRKVSRYALRSLPNWPLLAARCSQLSNFRIEQQYRFACVLIHMTEADAQALDPDDHNFKAIQPDSMTALAKALHGKFSDDYLLRVESRMCWALLPVNRNFYKVRLAFVLR